LSSTERRTRLRFPLNTQLRFQVVRSGHGKLIEGTGQVDNISSKGLAFRSETPLARGQRLTVSIDWPAMLNENCLLRLTVEGTVIRTTAPQVVMSIENHGFRTAGRAPTDVRQELADVARTIQNLVPARFS